MKAKGVKPARRAETKVLCQATLTGRIGGRKNREGKFNAKGVEAADAR